MEKLEKHIINNRDQWDDQKAPDHLWDRIETQLDTSKEVGKSSDSKFWKGGFLLLVIGMATAGLFFMIASDTEEEMTSQAPLEFAGLGDFQETEHYYLTSIYSNLKELEKLDVDATLLEDLNQLDLQDQELRKEYENAQHGYKEQILHALIINHQTKLGLLQKVLLEMNNKKNTEHEIL